MAVKELNRYKHYGNRKHYDFICIALPKHDKPKSHCMTQKVFHTENQEWINLHTFGNVSFTDENEYLVIYQAEDDMDANHLFARPVDMFFEHIDGKTKRFTEV